MEISYQKSSKRKQASSKSFRLRTQYVFLTYPKCGIALLELLHQLRERFANLSCEIVQHIIAHELHEDGTPHRHCWFELSNPPGSFPHRALDVIDNDEARNGKYEDCKDASRVAKYCIKDGHFITSFGDDELKKLIAGAKPIPISKHEVASQMLSGTKLCDIVKKHPALLWEYKKLVDNYALYLRDTNKPSRRDRLDNIWYWGPPGSGKSMTVFKDYPLAFKKEKSEFWGGYNYEEAVVFEDVDFTWDMILWSFKDWFDYAPFPAKVKHEKPMMIRPLVMIVTSNYTIEELVTNICKAKNLKFDQFFVRALERRFQQIRIDPQENEFIEQLDLFPDNYFCNPL